MAIEPKSDDDAAKRTQTLRNKTGAGETAASTSPTPPAPPPPSDSDVEKVDDREPNNELRKMRRQRALADANKPIEVAAEAIWSMDPDKVKARTTIEEAYRTAARKGSNKNAEGELHARYRQANDKFVDAAADMLRTRASFREGRLASWIKTYLTHGNASGDAKVRQILRERKQVAKRLIGRLGPREEKRQTTADETKRWEKAFGRWSSPDKEIGGLIASYYDRIDQLNADINTGNNRDQAIFSFWFEVAPIHLQLRPDEVNEANTPGVEDIQNALEDEFPDLVRNYMSGKDRKDSKDRKDDGSVYLIDPDELAEHRKAILLRWQTAAEDQADAEADYGTRPDAAADLKPRHDKLKDDGWVKGAKEALAAPKP